ncbi:hypothetical protein [Kitasatospora sp. NPDC093806]|uniref:hypothetical protein n=1 Tax=Kitasatospora sp. NPDC093806 TaxID=3155075 RepID=UPI00341476AD
MTVHRIEGASDPSIHALVIGVGVYRNCGRTAPLGALKRKLLTDLKTPLTCAPISAAYVAHRLIKADWSTSPVKLGSVDVLLSVDPATPWPDDLPRPASEPAVYDNVKGAWRAWVDRCNRNPDNIALLYFCGHGWGGMQHYLLVEDFAEKVDQWPYRMIDFNRTRLSMQTCDALTQCFLLDICSNEPDGLAALRIQPPDLIVDNREEAELRMQDEERMPNNLVLKPTPNGYANIVRPGKVTPFADAFVKTLDGLGAIEENGFWDVRSRYLELKMREVLDWFWPDLRGGKRLHLTPGEYGHDTVLRRFQDAPMVPFRLVCDPDTARSSAHWELECLKTDARHQQPGPGVWEAETEASSYNITVNWNDGVHDPVKLRAVSIKPANATAPIIFKDRTPETEGRVD